MGYVATKSAGFSWKAVLLSPWWRQRGKADFIFVFRTTQGQEDFCCWRQFSEPKHFPNIRRMYINFNFFFTLHSFDRKTEKIIGFYLRIKFTRILAYDRAEMYQCATIQVLDVLWKSCLADNMALKILVKDIRYSEFCSYYNCIILSAINDKFDEWLCKECFNFPSPLEEKKVAS